MNLLSHRPAPPLDGFIDSLWLLEDAPAHARERILPSGTLELVINLREDEFRIYDPSGPGDYRRFSGAMVSGAYGEGFVIDAAQHACVLGVHFKPGGAFPFLGMPAGEIADAHVDLEMLWGQRAVELRERLCAAQSAPGRFRLLEEALTVHLLPRAHHAAVPAALAAFERTASRVRDVARLVGLSQRRFIQVFTAEVGMTPKRFHRVRRFQRARALALRSPGPDWARLAVACGYCDQSHLIHDFLAFSGLSPADYLRQRSERVKEDHVPLAG
jgi:AraC-like DNA-binding protein